MSDTDDTDKHPLAGCILYEEVKRGEYNPKFYYSKGGLPDIGTDPIPLWSNFAYINGKYDKQADE